jgi:hypothetical protein
MLAGDFDRPGLRESSSESEQDGTLRQRHAAGRTAHHTPATIHNEIAGGEQGLDFLDANRPSRAGANEARSVHDGFTLGLAIAAAGLLLGAAIYEGIRRAYPVHRSAHRLA